MSATGDFTELLNRPAGMPPGGGFDDTIVPHAIDVETGLAALPPRLLAALRFAAAELIAHPGLATGNPRRTLEAVNAMIDLRMSGQLNHVLHHPEFQALEASWRGLHFLVRTVQTDPMLKIRLFDISQRELSRTLRKFRGTAWDHSPVFKKIYEEEYGQLGGEPFGVLIGDYYFDHQPQNIQLLADMSAIAAAAHAPFIAGAAPALMQMDEWAELANPRDLTRIFQTPEYAAWRALRETEDSRYLGLCMPRMLSRLPYGVRTDPIDDFAFEEEVEGAHANHYAWANPAFAMGANIARSFSVYGWCTRINGVETGGIVEDLPILHFSTADGDTDTRSCTEIALNERREAELSRLGLIPLVYRKNTEVASFISAHSLQKPNEYDDPAATANAVMSARLPYMFACCRFSHYLKCMVRDKVGGTKSRVQLQDWLTDWLLGYVDGSPTTSSEEWKASHPLEAAEVTLEEKPDKPGQYEARFFLKPHYQLEGLTVALRLVSRLPAQ
jgi:type VI secretion system protein ImpC